MRILVCTIAHSNEVVSHYIQKANFWLISTCWRGWLTSIPVNYRTEKPFTSSSCQKQRAKGSRNERQRQRLGRESKTYLAHFVQSEKFLQIYLPFQHAERNFSSSWRADPSTQKREFFLEISVFARNEENSVKILGKEFSFLMSERAGGDCKQKVFEAASLWSETWNKISKIFTLRNYDSHHVMMSLCFISPRKNSFAFRKKPFLI